ncbi:hypothetical protein C8F04DRAFT_1180901 [Mycena alexandri]|uniref:Uncharacterized protein n=1 Tax=Mycena alexandri TaxID=1745969 RepID=A0AAD6T0H4_9AGAR|nr:hypothetical protein C8F04DRAFT_1180901 [Mycena alexandri]
MERKFTHSDLTDLTRSQLVELVEAQLHLWPVASKGKFRRGKTNMKVMTDALLTGQFTTREPLSPAPSGNILPLPLPVLPVPVENSAESQHATTQIVPVVPFILADADISQVSEEPGPSSLPTDAALEGMNTEGRTCSIVLLIEDTRHFFNDKISQRVQVPVAHSGDGKTQVNAKDVILALQTSIAACEGPARIGTPDLENPEFTTFFGILEGREYIELAENESQILVVPRDRRLELTIARIGFCQGVKAAVREEKPATTPLPDPFTQFEEFTRTEQVRLAASPAATTVKKKPPKPLTSEERDWLTAKVEAMGGFETFKKHHNQRLNNLNRVLYWKFAADFSRKYYKTEWPILRVDHEHSNGTLIRKHALETVLNMKTTALNQAINMSRILDKCYHGATKSREVVDSVENTESESLGSEALVNFLLAWDKEHLGFGVN